MNSKRWNKSRREFLIKSITGVTSVSLLPSLIKGKGRAKREKNIIYRTLGRTELKIPIVSLGCGLVDNPQLVRAALDAGVVYFDTAPGYGSGANESILGEVFKGRPRDSFVVATKIGLPADNRTGLLPENISPAQFKAYFHNALDTSLKHLQLGCLDILYLYGPKYPDLIGLQLVKDVMLEVKEERKASFLGVSFHQNEPAMIQAAVDEKIYDVILTAYNFRQPHRKEVKKAIAYAAKAGLGVVAMKTMAGVYWDKERKHPINAKAALKWILQDENVHTTIPGISTFDQLELDMSVMEDLTLTPKEQEDLKLGQKTAMSGLYCAQCNRCRLQCRYNLDIPTLMRSYMYAYGYKNPAKARETLQFLDLSNLACNRCPTCRVKCTMGFDVRDKVIDIARIKHVPKEFLV
jgi:predicted aldo/keto reductase-like oxidoreductase